MLTAHVFDSALSPLEIRIRVILFLAISQSKQITIKPVLVFLSVIYHQVRICWRRTFNPLLSEHGMPSSSRLRTRLRAEQSRFIIINPNLLNKAQRAIKVQSYKLSRQFVHFYLRAWHPFPKAQHPKTLIGALRWHATSCHMVYQKERAF